MNNDDSLRRPAVSRRTALCQLTGAGAALCTGSVSQLLFAADEPSAATGQPGVTRVEFVYEQAPFPSCHAATIAETSAGLVAAWFGGTAEGNDDVTIWVARREGDRWTAPVEAADGIDNGKRRYPCWNPVLFNLADGTLALFYKVGPSPSRWWGLFKRSSDQGRTWSALENIPLGIFGPIRNKPVRLADGTILCGASTEHEGWQVQMERADAGLKKWEKTAPLNDGTTYGLIQPTILTHAGGRLQILCRSKQKRIVEMWSDDNGRTWTAPQKSALINNNSGIDGVTLADGRQLLVYNHTERGRSPLNVAVSNDGKTWQAALVLENTPGEFSYPAVIQTKNGQVHITYTWNRKRIRHVAIDPQKLVLRDMPDGRWPA
jgi:predicted neuraminidase